MSNLFINRPIVAMVIAILTVIVGAVAIATLPDSQAASFADLKWWEVFRDAELQGLIKTALEQNYGLRDAVTRIEMAQAKLVRVPGKWAMQLVLRYLWTRQISAIPPEALPYMSGEYIMNTDRLRTFLGAEYENVMRHTIADAFADSFKSAPAPAQSVK